MPADRHRGARVYVRVTPAQRADLEAFASACGVTLNTLARSALDSFVASLRTAKVREAKAARRVAAVTDPCDDPACGREYNHPGKCNFARVET